MFEMFHDCETVKCNLWSIDLYGAETWILRTIYIYIYIYLESFEMWCCRRMEKISWNDRVKNEEVLQMIKEEINRRKASWIDHIRRTNCLLKHVMER
jgi:hypothetical protein